MRSDTVKKGYEKAPHRALLRATGVRWLKRALAVALHLLPEFKARLSNLNLQPVLSPLAQNRNV